MMVHPKNTSITYAAMVSPVGLQHHTFIAIFGDIYVQFFCFLLIIIPSTSKLFRNRSRWFENLKEENIT